MEEKTLKLFQENYTKKGMCSDLPKYLKIFKKEYKKTNSVKEITYYPWAVVERFFRMQGGQVEVVEWATRVAFPFTDYAPNEDGELVMTQQEQHALFIHLKATWQGLEENEYYPIFDNQNSKIIKTPNALDLNKARQRGMVRLVARISGIGLDIFEQTDTQFDDDEDFKTQAETTSIKVETKAKVKPVKKVEPQVEVQEEVEEPNQSDFLESFLKGDEIENPEDVGIRKMPKEEFTNETQEYADLLLEVRKIIRDSGAQQDAKNFVKEQGLELLSELSYSQLEQLKESI
jgi:hypothetical protein